MFAKPHPTLKLFLALTPLVIGGSLLQNGCVLNALRFEINNLVATQVFIAAQTIFDNYINFSF